MKFLETGTFDIEQVVSGLKSNRAVSVPILSQLGREFLFQDVVGRHSSGYFIGELGDSHLLVFVNEFQEFMRGELKKTTEYPFRSRLCFTRIEVGKYGPKRILSPHTDKDDRNLTCVFNIGGLGKFYTCDDDKKGANPQEFDSSPGRVVMFTGGTPHKVYSGERERYVVVMRQFSDGAEDFQFTPNSPVFMVSI